MKKMYMDLGMGAEKEKLCAALFDLLDDEKKADFVKTVEGLGLEGVSVKACSAEKDGIEGSEFAILVDGMTEAQHKHAHSHHGDHDHDHEHHHDHEHEHFHHNHHEHVHRGMTEIREIVDGLNGISGSVKEDIMGVYDIVAAAEAEVHESTPDKVHFHEVGEMYAIATVCSYCILMDMLGDKEVYSTPVRTGKGMIECAHGLLPVPAPATAAIIRGIPVFAGDIDAELTTPTGAAMVNYYVKEFCEGPAADAERTGIGFGVKELSEPDIVKVMMLDRIGNEKNMEELQGKYNKLKDHLASLGSLAVGFSGGVDSAFLLAAAHEALGDSLIAVTARSHFVPESDLDEAIAFCKERGIRHFIVDLDPLANDTIRSNPADRCYHCKKIEFGAIMDKAREHGIEYVADGSNADDRNDYRPGARAVGELGIVSPLQEAGLTKAEIRELSKSMGLPTWKKPSAACLASRIPYGEELTREKLARVDAAESFIRSLGFTNLRVRSHGDLARIELAPEETGRMADDDLRKTVSAKLKELGFTYVTVDLEGYRMGSLNKEL